METLSAELGVLGDEASVIQVRAKCYNVYCTASFYSLRTRALTELFSNQPGSERPRGGAGELEARKCNPAKQF